MLDIQSIRQDFPILEQKIYKRPLVYLDNAATTQKPRQVIEAIDHYYRASNANIHRGVHFLSQQATLAHEETREYIRKMMNAKHSHEIIFTRGTTESINLVASSFGKAFIQKGDSILVSTLEHHSNIVPWQFVCEERGAILRVIPITTSGDIDLEVLKTLLDERVKIIAITHISNALGTVTPIREIIQMAHAHNIPVLVDGAQAIAHVPVDVQALDADFYCFSGHKVYGPMGIGVLYGKEKWLDAMPPYQGGGEMIKEVTFEKTTYSDLPFKFEAGTPSVADTIGLHAALAYLEGLGIEAVGNYEDKLLTYALNRLKEHTSLRLIGEPAHRAGVISFLPNQIHPYDMGTILDKLGIALRTGNHCAQPLMTFYGIQGTLRASFALYNTLEEIDMMMEAIGKAEEMFL